MPVIVIIVFMCAICRIDVYMSILKVEYLRVMREESEKEQRVYKHRQAIWRQYEAVVSKQTKNVKGLFTMFDKWQHAQQCRSFIDAISVSDTFTVLSELYPQRWLS